MFRVTNFLIPEDSVKRAPNICLEEISIVGIGILTYSPSGTLLTRESSDMSEGIPLGSESARWHKTVRSIACSFGLSCGVEVTPVMIKIAQSISHMQIGKHMNSGLWFVKNSIPIDPAKRAFCIVQTGNLSHSQQLIITVSARDYLQNPNWKCSTVNLARKQFWIDYWHS